MVRTKAIYYQIATATQHFRLRNADFGLRIWEGIAINNRRHGELQNKDGRRCVLPSKSAIRIRSNGEPARFQNLFDVGEETLGVGPVDDSVVEGEREVCHVSYGYNVVALFGRDYPSALLYRADAEYCDLRLVDDGRAEEAAEDAGVRDGEGSARDLV